MNCAYIRLSEEDINKSKDFSESIINQIELIRRIIASGYLLITLLISCIVYIWYNEWQEMETLEFYNL